MHWINFPVIAVMIWSGMLIYWANDIYNFRLGSIIIFHFFPQGFYQFFNIPYNLAKGMSFHFVFMWLFMLNGIAYVTFTIISGEWKYLIPNNSSLSNAWKTLLHDLHLKKEKPEQLKYNGAQQIAYTIIILMGIGSVISGIAIYKPVQQSWALWIFGGYGNARVFHFIMTIGYVLFFIIHIIQVIRYGWNNFQAMVTGFEKKSEILSSSPIIFPTKIENNEQKLGMDNEPN